MERGGNGNALHLLDNLGLRPRDRGNTRKTLGRSRVGYSHDSNNGVTINTTYSGDNTNLILVVVLDNTESVYPQIRESDIFNDFDKVSESLTQTNRGVRQPVNGLEDGASLRSKLYPRLVSIDVREIGVAIRSLYHNNTVFININNS